MANTRDRRRSRCHSGSRSLQAVVLNAWLQNTAAASTPRWKHGLGLTCDILNRPVVVEPPETNAVTNRLDQGAQLCLGREILEHSMN